VNRSLAQSATSAYLGVVRFMDGANITANGNMVWTNVQTAFVVESGASATVGGTGVVDITFNNANAYFAGYSWASSAALTLGGAGRLALRAPGMLVNVMCNTFTLSRAASMFGSGGTLGILSGRKALITGVGSSLTMETNTTLRVLRINSWDNTSFVRVHGGGSLKLDGARVEGYAPGADPYALHLSDDGSAASLILAAGMSNTIAGMQSSQKLSVRLGSGAAVDVGAGSVLNLQQAALHVAITNPACWGWSTNGTLAIGAEATVEALNNDLGPRVNLKTLPFVIDRLSFTATNATLTLAETTDNDGGGPDRALYVRILDLSALQGGTVDLDGFSGAERIYYGTLINPNGVSFVTPGEWIQVRPLGTVIQFL